jgi:hypothetical protein
MSNTLNIPAAAVGVVREALFVLMSEAAEALASSLAAQDRERNPDWFEDDRERLEHAWALLDELGWDADAAPRPVAVDVDVYGEDLREALELLRPLLAMQEREAEAGDRWRVEQGKPPRKAQIARDLAQLGLLAADLDSGEEHG